MRGAQRKRELVALLEQIAAGQALDGPIDAERLTDELLTRTAMVRVPAPTHVPLPFAKPEGFVLPVVWQRRPTERRLGRLRDQLAAKRPETRRATILMFGGLASDSVVGELIRSASELDPDPYCRGLAIMCLGLAASDPPETLLAGAERLVTEAGTRELISKSWDLAWEAAAYGVLGALAAAVRAGGHDLDGQLRQVTERLDPSPTSEGSDAPGRRRAALLEVLAH